MTQLFLLLRSMKSGTPAKFAATRDLSHHGSSAALNQAAALSQVPTLKLGDKVLF